jgi:hypothetical protein
VKEEGKRGGKKTKQQPLFPFLKYAINADFQTPERFAVCEGSS